MRFTIGSTTLATTMTLAWMTVQEEAWAQLQFDDPANWRSYTSDSYSCTQGTNKAATTMMNDTDTDHTTSIRYSLDYLCDSLSPPTAWQKTNPDTVEAQYDLIVIGGGIGGAYLVSRLLEEFDKKGQPYPKIALFERSTVLGGRLMSAYGTGALGMAVQPREEGHLGEDTPLQEYGGMRIDPNRYPLIFNKVIQQGQQLYGAENCKPPSQWAPQENGCPGMLSRMEVGAVRYATTRTDLGELLASSSVFTPSETYVRDKKGVVLSTYSLQDIAKGKGSPFDKCAQLVVATFEFGRQSGLPDEEIQKILWKPFIENTCANCTEAETYVPGMCALCADFPNPAEAVISCMGYDNPVEAPAASIADMADEVLNVRSATNLYILRQGFQRFVMGLLHQNEELGIAPHLRTAMTGISINSGEDPETLAQAQIDSIDAEAQYVTVPSEKTMTVTFADGSKATATSVYMTMLPFDLPHIEGFDPWMQPLQEAVVGSMATKVVLGWTDPDKALAKATGLTPCVPGPCERMILDGPPGTNLVRQLWLWDDKTAMVYNTNWSAGNIQAMSWDQGMDATIMEIMAQIRAATGLTEDVLADPDWARSKPWPMGTFTSWNPAALAANYNNATFNQFAAHISRPLGYDVPVYYGNSEAAADDALHGWAEGALEMVEDNLQSLASYLGLEGEVERPSEATINVLDPAEPRNDGGPDGDTDTNDAGGDADGSDGTSAAVGFFALGTSGLATIVAMII